MSDKNVLIQIALGVLLPKLKLEPAESAAVVAAVNALLDERGAEVAPSEIKAALSKIETLSTTANAKLDRILAELAAGQGGGGSTPDPGDGGGGTDDDDDDDTGTAPPPPPPPGIFNPVVGLDAAARRWSLREPLPDWRDVIRWPLMPLVGRLEEFRLELDMVAGSTDGLRSLMELRADQPGKWPKTFLLVDLNDNEGGKIIATDNWGRRKQESPFKVVRPLPLRPGDRLQLVVQLDALGLKVLANGARVIDLVGWTRPELGVGLYLTAGHGRDNGPEHPVNAGTRIDRLDATCAAG